MVIASLFFALAAVATTDTQPDLEVKDWRAACDNVRHCRAGTSTPEIDSSKGAVPPNELTLTIDRSGDPMAVPVVDIWQMGRRAYFIATRDGSVKIPIPVTADPPAASSNSILALNPQDHTLSPEIGEKVIAATKMGGNLNLLDKQGRVVGTVSMAGANAVLLWIDDQQRRIGTPTAFIRRGNQSVSSIPHPPQLPIVHAARPSNEKPVIPSSAVLRKLLQNTSCNERAYPKDFEYHRLDSRHTFILLNCPDFGENPNGDVSVINDNSPKRPFKPKIPDTVGQSWDWDPKAHTLTDGMISHGIDCSYREIFVWTGTAFVRKENYEVCRGNQYFTYRARVIYGK